MRRVHLRGRENIAKRYLIHTAAFHLGLITRQRTGFGTPRGWADARAAAARRLCALWNGLLVRLRRGARVPAARRNALFAAHRGPAAA